MQPLLLNVMQMQCMHTNAMQCMLMHTTCSRSDGNVRTSRQIGGLKKREQVSQAVLLVFIHVHVASCRLEDLFGGCRRAVASCGNLRGVIHLVSAAQAVDVYKRLTWWQAWGGSEKVHHHTRTATWAHGSPPRTTCSARSLTQAARAPLGGGGGGPSCSTCECGLNALSWNRMRNECNECSRKRMQHNAMQMQ